MMAIRELAGRAALVLGLIGAPGPEAGAEELPVDLELVLAVDISGSVDGAEARLQREGYIAALRHPRVIEAIKDGMLGRVALTYIEWAGDDYQRTVLDWALVEDATGAFALADALAEAPLISAQWTSLSGALDYARPRFDGNGFKGMRRVIDISGDGYNNRGRPVERARDQAVAAGITINGLPIVNDRPNPWGSLPPKDLDHYFEDRVIGGPGAFIVVAKDYTAFASAILSKLLLEIAGGASTGTELSAAARDSNGPTMIQAMPTLRLHRLADEYRLPKPGTTSRQASANRTQRPKSAYW